MDALYERCCGLDVHKKTVVACLRKPSRGGRRKGEVRTFGTTTGELLALADWLTENRCTHVAMESTGVYWKPIYNVLENLFVVWVVNAHHIKAVPGRKTDVRDCEWIAELLEHGLLRPSFIPPLPVRELRDLTRYRKTLVEMRSAESNRVQKVLETANIKLSSVATDVLGASGRAMLTALIEGNRDASQIADLAKGTLRTKRGHLTQALAGRFSPHHAFLLRQILGHVDELNRHVAECEAEIGQRLAPLAPTLALMRTMPCLGQRTSEVITAETGLDMARFPTAAHFASWAGVCPGNNESGGKRKAARSRKGNIWLKSALVEAAWVASHRRDTYYGALFARIARRRGSKRAVLAVAHAMAVALWHMLSKMQPYREIAPASHESVSRDVLARQYVRRLERLGLRVTVEAA